MAGKMYWLLQEARELTGTATDLPTPLLTGAVAADNNVVRFDAGRMNIGPCKACDKCFTNDGA